MLLKESLNYELTNFPNEKIIAGFDEAGRGCCAGPLVVACVVFNNNYQNNLINDSKKLSINERKLSYETIIKDALDVKVEIIEPAEVDKLNPKQASKIGMLRCLEKLKIKPSLLITDFEKIDQNTYKQLNLVKGDSKAITVAAASIIAKVTRDNIMDNYANIYPQYQFHKHKGYCTKMHQEAIEKYGILDIHRKSYKNIKKIIDLQKVE
ncbi:ribonuclease HII [Mycoplasmopsis opalescens]|uniref:ribonuclease HII n=1 Tax=Mycoplasmopsis opalescens TaxID=114886 RepID=UPI0004A6B747|nr:ribonuclease HII [Mycoplasmopsis opalescens]